MAKTADEFLAGASLTAAERGRTRALRQWRMHSDADFEPQCTLRHVHKAARPAATGCRVLPRPLSLPLELSGPMAADEAARRAFDALSPGWECEFAAFTASRRRADTRGRRLQKALLLIRRGAELNDRDRRWQPRRSREPADAGTMPATRQPT